MNHVATTDKERIERMLAHLKITQNKFGTSIGDKNGMRFRHVLDGRNKISEKLAKDIVEVFPCFNYVWILTGEGEMLSAHISNHINASIITPKSLEDDALYNSFGNTFIPLENGGYMMETPLIPEYVRGGPMSGFSDREYFDELPKHRVIVDKIHRGKYISAVMRGDSMYHENSIDGIKENAVLTGRECQKIHWKSKLSLGKDFIIAHKDGLIVKRIIAHDVPNGMITCHSLNPDKDSYPDFELHLDDVDALFNVIKVENPR